MSWKFFSTWGLVISLEKSVFLPSTLCSPSTHFADVLKWHKCLVPHLYVPKISHPKPILLNLTFLPSLVHPDLDVQQWPVSCLFLIIMPSRWRTMWATIHFLKQLTSWVSTGSMGTRVTCICLAWTCCLYGGWQQDHMGLKRLHLLSHAKDVDMGPAATCHKTPTRPDSINYLWDRKGVPDPGCYSSTISNAIFYVFIKKWLTV